MPDNKSEEDIHYGDIRFSDPPGRSSVSVRNNRRQQETVYSQIQVSKPESSSAQTPEGPEDLYAQVNKK